MSAEVDPNVVCPLVGSSVDEYDVVGLLGFGAMGCVYRVRHRVMRKEFALKMLATERISSGIALQRFHREAHATAQIDHPNVVRVVYSGRTQSQQTYLVMELLEGESLSAVTARGIVPPDRAAKIARDVALGLEEIHRNGFVHRDIKPGNLMVAPDGTVKILDLGLVGLTEPVSGELKLTQQGHLMGTPLYMSPEAFSGEGGDPRGDLYALGAVLYEMLTGRPPFIGTLKEIMWHSNFTEPEPLPPSDGLETLVMTLLAKDPIDRPKDARAVIAAIDARKNKPAVVITEVIERPARPRRKKIWPWAGGVLAVAVLGTLILRAARVPEVVPLPAPIVAAPAPPPLEVEAPAPVVEPVARIVEPPPPSPKARARAVSREVLITSEPAGARGSDRRGPRPHADQRDGRRR